MNGMTIAALAAALTTGAAALPTAGYAQSGSGENGGQADAAPRIVWNPLTATEARRLLERRGYGQIGIIETYDDLYQTRAMRDARVVTIWIDPDTRIYEEVADPPVAEPVAQSASDPR